MTEVSAHYLNLSSVNHGPMASVAKRLLNCSAALAGLRAAALLRAARAAAIRSQDCSLRDTLEALRRSPPGRRRRRDAAGSTAASASCAPAATAISASSPQLGNVSLVWRPQFSWSLSATVVGAVQGGERTQAGLSQAYLTFRPMRGGKIAFSARAGLMWPPVSLEHEGADWHVADSITPSAINSWIGEEVRPVAAEATVAGDLGQHKLRATAAIIAANDTAGTLLTFRGWALHDRMTLAFRRQPLPPFGETLQDYQPRFTHPLLDIDGGLRAPARLLCQARLAAAGAGSSGAVPLRQSRRSRRRQ